MGESSISTVRERIEALKQLHDNLFKEIIALPDSELQTILVDCLEGDKGASTRPLRDRVFKYVAEHRQDLLRQLRHSNYEDFEWWSLSPRQLKYIM